MSIMLRSIGVCMLLFLFFLHIVENANGWIQCPEEEGGGICPDLATCCKNIIRSDNGEAVVSSCITGNKNYPDQIGSCCHDDDNDEDNVVTGCGVGYDCATTSYSSLPFDADNDDNNNAFIQLRNAIDDNNDSSSGHNYEQHQYCKRRMPPNDPSEPKQLPRYKTCTLPSKDPKSDILRLHGFPVKVEERYNNNNNNNDGTKITTKTNEHQTKYLAYYSSFGHLPGLMEEREDDDDQSESSSSLFETIQTVMVVIHGSGRNADDYYCCGLSSLPENNSSNILVLAPRFLSPHDEPTEESPQIDFLRWIDEEHDPYLSHTWRYGANAVDTTNTSSFQAIDEVVEYFVSNKRKFFPSLNSIVITGHSAGGQFTQRWALTSMSSAWLGNHKNNDDVSIRVVVMNPRCFAYLDNRRYMDDHSFLEPPSDDRIYECPDYNEWIWGLEAGGAVAAPYKDYAIKDAGGIRNLIKRYLFQRNVIYLNGEYDTIEYPNDNCGTLYQGKNRLQRGLRFYKSIQHIYHQEYNNKNKNNITTSTIATTTARRTLRAPVDNTTEVITIKNTKTADDYHHDAIHNTSPPHNNTMIHKHMVVNMVNHDHCLMMQSPEGQRALFG